MLSRVDIFLLSVGYVINRLSPKEKKQLEEWRSQSQENESHFQDLIDPEKIKARWKRAEDNYNEYLRVRDASLQKLKEKHPETWKPKKVKKLHGKYKPWPKIETNNLATKIKK
jgi:hypothetical protein